MKKILSSTYLFILSINIANAQQLTNPINATDIPSLIGIIIKGALGIVGSLSLIMFIYGGILWMTSGGNDSQIKKGKDTLVWATAGLFIVFASYSILRFVFKILGQ